MEILWKRGESNAHGVMQTLERPLAYTTVMTTLHWLFKKGLLDCSNKRLIPRHKNAHATYRSSGFRGRRFTGVAPQVLAEAIR